jgi:hypothetical protein
MTKPDGAARDADLSDSAILMRRAIVGIGGGVLLLFLTGMMAGYLAAAMEQGPLVGIDFAILAAMLTAVTGTAVAMWRYWPRAGSEPEAARVKRARSIMIATAVLGGLFGVFLGVGSGGTEVIFSDGPVPPGMALIAIIIWLVMVPLLTWLWWRLVDEHEATAYRDGAFAAMHAYIFVAPAWWMAARAGWLPDQNPMAVMMAVCLVWTIVWFRKRYL